MIFSPLLKQNNGFLPKINQEIIGYLLKPAGSDSPHSESFLAEYLERLRLLALGQPSKWKPPAQRGLAGPPGLLERYSSPPVVLCGLPLENVLVAGAEGEGWAASRSWTPHSFFQLPGTSQVYLSQR